MHTRTELVFCYSLTESDEFEARSRGYLSHVLVKVDGGDLYPVIFYDYTRLGQDLEEMARHGKPFIADPGLIVVADVIFSILRDVVESLANSDYFNHIVPTTMEEALGSGAQWPPPIKSASKNQ
jgi:hypothetical protein